VTPVLRTNVGFHILKLNNVRKPEAEAAGTAGRGAADPRPPHHAEGDPDPDRGRRPQEAARPEGEDRGQAGPASKTWRARIRRTLRRKGGDMGWLETGDIPAGIRDRDERAEAGRDLGPGQDPVRLHI
jgi:peptidyl-prolyl cis-trans isomerase SurA